MGRENITDTRLEIIVCYYTDLWTDPVWVVGSTPVECARSRPTVKSSNLAGWAGDGYCASHSRFFWGLRPHLVCTPTGLPITWALADPKLHERQVLMAILEHDPTLTADRPGLIIISDKGYTSAELDRSLTERGVALPRPSYPNRAPTPLSTCSSRSASSLSQSTTPSKANSIGNYTADAVSTASAPASPHSSSP